MALIDNPIVVLTQQDLLDLIDRLFPDSYLYPLKDPGPGYEVIQALAKIFARCSQAVETLGHDAFMLISSSGSRATGTVQLRRAAIHPDGISVTVKAGSILTTSIGGRDFLTTEDVVFGPTDVGPFNVGVQAISVGYEWNVPGEVTTAAGEVLAGDIDTVKMLVEDPDYGDVTIQVSQTAATSGGTDDALSGLGGDRGMMKLPGELADPYRVRIRQLADTISPDAFKHAMDSALSRYGAHYWMIETWEPSFCSCWNAPTTPVVGSPFDPTWFVFNNPRAHFPFGGRWFGQRNYRAAVIVVVDNLQWLEDTSMAWLSRPGPAVSPTTPPDFGTAITIGAGSLPGRVLLSTMNAVMDPSYVGQSFIVSGADEPENNGTFTIVSYVSTTSAEIWNPLAVLPDANSGAISATLGIRVVDRPTAADYLSSPAGGRRACCAYNVPASIPGGWLRGAYSGADLPKQAVYKGLLDLLQAVKAGGVGVELVMKGQ